MTCINKLCIILLCVIIKQVSKLIFLNPFDFGDDDFRPLFRLVYFKKKDDIL